MSLLGSQVFANPSTPLWLSNAGGVITGNLTVEGQVYAEGGLVTLEPGAVSVLNTTGAFIQSQLAHATGATLIKSNDPVVFAKVGAANGNTSLTTSVLGANTDLLSVGGRVSATGLTLGSAGAAPTVGRSTLVAGQAVVNTTASDITAYIQLTHTNLNASTGVGTLRVVAKNANSFTVNSVTALGAIEAGDLSDFDWVIINPA